jgi:replicative DNA helicase
MSEEKKPSLFSRVYENIVKRRERLLSGKINCIPWGLPRFEEDHPGLEQGKNVLFTANSKVGKCFGKNTPVLMYNGNVKLIQDILENDILIGPDSKPRVVTGVTSGTQEMFKITQKYGNNFICNKDHILYLRVKPGNNKKESFTTMTVEEYLNDKNKFKYKMIQSNEIEFENNINLELDPYFYGLWLGDGDTTEVAITNIDDEIVNYIYKFAELNNCKIKKVGSTSEKYGKIRYNFSEKILLKSININNNSIKYYDKVITASNNDRTKACYISRATNNGKIVNNCKWEWINKSGFFRKKFKNITGFQKLHINPIYLKSTIENRYKLLAGIIDSDGHKRKINNSYEICTKHETLANDYIYLARSLGLRSFKHTKYVNNTPYYKVYVSGYNCYKIPVLLDRKKCHQKEVKSNLYRTFEIESIGIDTYYGFTVDKDHLFLLSDFTIVHNTQICDFLVLFNPIKKIIDEGLDIRLKIFYFTLEMTAQQKMLAAFSHILYVKEGLRIAPKDLRSTKESNLLPQETLDIIKKYEPYFNKIEEVVEFIDDVRHPTGMRKLINAVLDRNILDN